MKGRHQNQPSKFVLSLVAWFALVYSAIIYAILELSTFLFEKHPRFPTGVRFRPSVLFVLIMTAWATWTIISHLRIYTSPKRALDASGKDFILFLRPFRTDIGMIKSWWSLVVRGLTSYYFRPPPPLEQDIADELRSFAKFSYRHRPSRRFGGLVSIGRPSERFSPLGSTRLYVEHETWKSQVTRLLQQCKAVILVAGNSEGAIYEQVQARERCKPHRLLMLFLPSKKKERLELLRRSEKVFNLHFPKAVANHPNALSAVRFSQDWTPKIQPVPVSRPRIVWRRLLIAEEYIDMNSVLGDFLFDALESEDF
jgi:hypothetical protein